MGTKVSPQDAEIYLWNAKRQGWINGFKQFKANKKVLWEVEVPSTHYDHYHGVEWVKIVLSTREVCAFMEGCYAATGFHPNTRPGAYRASWEQGHVSPHPFSQPE